MSKPYNHTDAKGFDRNLLIGLGNSSARKSYYPELQQRISDLEKAQALLIESEHRYRLAVEVSSDAIWDWDIRENIWSISSKWVKKLGLLTEPLVDGQPLAVIKNLSAIWDVRIHPDDVQRREKFLADHLAGKTEVFAVEYRYLVPPERWIWLAAKGKAILDEKGEPVRMIGSYADITSRKQQEERILHMAYHDSLTDLPNAASLHEKLEEFLGGKSSGAQQAGLFLLNIDNFKSVNDSWGYSCGDSLLIAIANRLAEQLSAAGMVARIGGDEFAVFIEMVDIVEIDAWAWRILDLFNKPIQACGNQIFVSCSIGIVAFNGKSSSDSILANATTALQYAKKAGKKTWRLFKEEMQQAVVRRLQMESELQQALVLEQFLVYYQPQVDSASGRIIGLEALVRWSHPQKGLVAPFEFIPLAEETGMIVPLGELIMRAACRFGNLLRRNQQEKIRIAVNISARQLMQEDFLPRLRRILREENYPPECFEIEITESILMESLSENIKKLKELRSVGIHIALDDFGTGYSSLTYLSCLPVDVLKIDKSFVQEIGVTANGAAIIGTIIQLAHQINMLVVAEGVETSAQLQSMRELKCDYLQGYLISRPVPAPQILEIYDKNQGVFAL